MTIKSPDSLFQLQFAISSSIDRPPSQSRAWFFTALICFTVFWNLGLLFASEPYVAGNPDFPNNWKFSSVCVIDSGAVVDSQKTRKAQDKSEARKIAIKFEDKLKRRVLESNKVTFFVNVPVLGELKVVTTVAEYPDWTIPISPTDDRARSVARALLDDKEYPLVPEQEQSRKNAMKPAKIRYGISSVSIMLYDESGKLLDSVKHVERFGFDMDEMVKEVVHLTRAHSHSTGR